MNNEMLLCFHGRIFYITSQIVENPQCCGVATLVLILGKSPYKDQNGKNGPYLVLILYFIPYFEAIEEGMANCIRLPVCQRRSMYIPQMK